MLENAITTALLLFLVVTAGTAIAFKDVLSSVLAYAVFGISTALLFLIYQAPDVAMAEAVVGTGLVTAFFLVTIGKVRREGRDAE